ncbi:MAG: hypothetical protein HKN32_03475 [Flavobacteriales bacterium]|nr:hypothetical protein [Flavobacteriales bacterium]
MHQEDNQVSSCMNLSDNGLLKIKVNEVMQEAKVDVPDINHFIRAISQYCGSVARPFLIDLRDIDGSVEVEASRLFASSPEMANVRLAQAFVVNSLSIRLLVNFYIRVHQPNCPSQVFSDVEEAEGWLSKYLN